MWHIWTVSIVYGMYMILRLTPYNYWLMTYNTMLWFDVGRRKWLIFRSCIAIIPSGTADEQRDHGKPITRCKTPYVIQTLSRDIPHHLICELPWAHYSHNLCTVKIPIIPTDTLWSHMPDIFFWWKFILFWYTLHPDNN